MFKKMSIRDMNPATKVISERSAHLCGTACKELCAAGMDAQATVSSEISVLG
jgi:O-acetylhomoserine/O-acetylserine sulfhydrylase-like pyridoxal-dependent enzyme